MRELGRGKSSVAFSYRIVGRRKDNKAHQRFAEVDARLFTRTATRASRRHARTVATLRTFVARLKKEAR